MKIPVWVRKGIIDYLHSDYFVQAADIYIEHNSYARSFVADEYEGRAIEITNNGKRQFVK